MTTPLHEVKRPCDLLVNIIWLFSESICFFFTLFFVFFETFVRVLFESSSNQLRKNGTFSEQDSTLSATWFNPNPNHGEILHQKLIIRSRHLFSVPL